MSIRTNNQERLLEDVGNAYSIISSLRKYKNTSSACLLLLYFAIEWMYWRRITKKSCQELLNGSPTQALKILRLCNIIDLSEWRLLEEPKFDNLEKDLQEEDNPLSNFSWKYGKDFHRSFQSYWSLLVSIAEGKRYTPEEYFDRLIAEVRKDDWWKNVITEEMLLRKIEFLNNKFGTRIPKKVWWLSEVSHVF